MSVNGSNTATAIKRKLREHEKPIPVARQLELLAEYTTKLATLAAEAISIRAQFSARSEVEVRRRQRCLRRFQYIDDPLRAFAQEMSGLLDHGAIALDWKQELRLRMAEFDAQYTDTHELLQELAALKPALPWGEPIGPVPSFTP